MAPHAAKIHRSLPMTQLVYSPRPRSYATVPAWLGTIVYDNFFIYG
jgi:hypothetical protein